jgi:hypothetical protein
MMEEKRNEKRNQRREKGMPQEKRSEGRQGESLPGSHKPGEADAPHVPDNVKPSF